MPYKAWAKTSQKTKLTMFIVDSPNHYPVDLSWYCPPMFTWLHGEINYGIDGEFNQESWWLYFHLCFWGNSPVRDFRNTCSMPVEISHKTCEINQVFTCCWHGKFIHPSGETFDYGETNYTKPINWGNDNWNSPIMGSIVTIGDLGTKSLKLPPGLLIFYITFPLYAIICLTILDHIYNSVL